MRERRGAIINEFLESFFLPLRKQYEADLEWYEKEWPLNKEEMEPATVNHLYAYGDQVSVKMVSNL